MSADLKLDPEDFGKLIKLDISALELNYLQRLLSFELVYQVRNIVGIEEETNSKVEKILSVFDSFKYLDNQIGDWLYDVYSVQNPHSAPEINANKVSTMVINKNIGKFYRILCTQTAKMKMDEEMLALKTQLNDNLVQKLNKAIEEGIDARQMTQEYQFSKFFPRKLEEKVKVNEKVNMFKKGLA